MVSFAAVMLQPTKEIKCPLHSRGVPRLSQVEAMIGQKYHFDFRLSALYRKRHLKLPFSEIQNYAVLLHAKLQFQKTYRGIPIQQRNIDKQGGKLNMGLKIDIFKLKMLRIIKKYLCTGLRSQLVSNRTRSKTSAEVPSNSSYFVHKREEKKTSSIIPDSVALILKNWKRVSFKFPL